jgi:predicted amidohydrolase YtcJ
MRSQLKFLALAWLAAVALPVARAAGTAPAPVADVVLTHARIYTAADPQLAEALAFRQGKLIYVGDARGVQTYLGAHTQRVDAGGRLVVPGLVDSHIHPVDIIDVDQCDLNSVGKSLRQLAAFILSRQFTWSRENGWPYTSGARPKQSSGR